MTASDLHRLAEDLPISAADVEALRQARARSAMSPAQIVAALRQLGPQSAAILRSRPLSVGEPFTLPEEP